jgi:hypothetical protein
MKTIEQIIDENIGDHREEEMQQRGKRSNERKDGNIKRGKTAKETGPNVSA